MSTNLYSGKIHNSQYRISITNWGMDGYCVTISDAVGNLEVVDLSQDFYSHSQEYLNTINMMRGSGTLPLKVELRATAIEFTINLIGERL